MFGVRQFARLPDELAEGNQHGHAHAAQQDDEHAAHVVDAQLVGVHLVVVRLPREGRVVVRSLSLG